MTIVHECLTAIPEEAATTESIVRIHVAAASGGMRVPIVVANSHYFVAPVDSHGARNQTLESSERTIHAEFK